MARIVDAQWFHAFWLLLFSQLTTVQTNVIFHLVSSFNFVEELEEINCLLLDKNIPIITWKSNEDLSENKQKFLFGFNISNVLLRLFQKCLQLDLCETIDSLKPNVYVKSSVVIVTKFAIYFHIDCITTPNSVDTSSLTKGNKVLNKNLRYFLIVFIPFLV